MKRKKKAEVTDQFIGSLFAEQTTVPKKVENVNVYVPFKTNPNLKLINTMEGVNQVLKEIESSTLCAVDSETSGLDFKKDHIVGLSLCMNDDVAYYLPFKHLDTNAKQLNWDEILPLLVKAFNRKDLFLVFHNFKFDGHMFREAGLNLDKTGNIHDTMIMAHLIDENQPKALKQLANRHIEAGSDHLQKAVKSFLRQMAKALDNPVKEMTYDYVPIDLMTQYAASDTLYTYKLHNIFWPTIKADENILRLYKMERYLTHVIMDMEECGMVVDRKFLYDAQQVLKEQFSKIKHEVMNLINKNVNIDSNQQLGKLFTELGIKTGKLTEDNQPCVDAKCLAKVVDKHPMIPLLLKYRKLKKLHGTYVKGLLNYVEDETGNLIGDGKIRPEFKQTGAKTARISCSQPNFQNLPNSSEKMPVNIRAAFTVPDKNHLMLFIDLSQIELRLTAHYSEDKTLLNAYHTGKDVHSQTAANMWFNGNLKQVNDDLRKTAKAINFGLIYGAGPLTLSETTGKSVEDCKKFMELYFKGFPGIARFIKQTQKILKQEGYVTNFYGRIRHVPDAMIPYEYGDPKKTNYKIFRACRQGANFLVQGTAADLFKFAMCRLSKALKAKKSHMVCNIHDEVIFYIHRDEIDLIPVLKGVMEGFKTFKVPIEAEVSYSFTNWAEKKKLKADTDLASLFPPKENETVKLDNKEIWDAQV